MIFIRLFNTRLLSMTFLGFASGLPLFLIQSTLQAWLTQAHASLATISLLSFMGLPYALKFIWAPLIDAVPFPWLGLRRGWMVSMQMGLAIATGCLAVCHPDTQIMAMLSLAFCIAFFSASQDVAIDAYRTERLLPEERGLGSAYFIFAYRVALLVSGGLALICADYIGFSMTYWIMAGLFLAMMSGTRQLAPVSEVPMATQSFWENTVCAFRDLLKRENISAILLFALCYKLGDALSGQLMTNFLLQGLGFSLTTIGLAYKVVGFVATICGALIGGILLLRWDIYRALLVFGVAQACSQLALVGLALYGKQLTLMMLAIFIENSCAGLGTAALLAWMMSLTRAPYTATQFALLSAITAVGRITLGPVAAYIVQHNGWETLFLWAAIISMPSLMMLRFVRSEEPAYA